MNNEFIAVDLSRNNLIKQAYLKGYFCDEVGNIYSPSRRKLALHGISDGRLAFSITFKGYSRKIPVHRFIAYIIWGDGIFDAQCVRHLDCDKFNNSPVNLDTGTNQDNQLDLAPERRSDKNRKGNRTKVLNSSNPQYLEWDLRVRIFKLANRLKGVMNSKKSIALKFGIHICTVYRILKQEYIKEYYNV